MLIKKDYEARGGVIRGFEKDEPSISEFSDTPKNSSSGMKTRNRRLGRGGSSDSVHLSQVLQDSPTSPEAVRNISYQQPTESSQSLQPPDEEEDPDERNKKNEAMAREQERLVEALLDDQHAFEDSNAYDHLLGNLG